MYRAECAAAAVLEMFKKGANGSVWPSMDNKPGRDITPEIDNVYKQLEEIMS